MVGVLDVKEVEPPSKKLKETMQLLANLNASYVDLKSKSIDKEFLFLENLKGASPGQQISRTNLLNFLIDTIIGACKIDPGAFLADSDDEHKQIFSQIGYNADYYCPYLIFPKYYHYVNFFDKMLTIVGRMREEVLKAIQDNNLDLTTEKKLI
jgi:hypothetical protein